MTKNISCGATSIRNTSRSSQYLDTKMRSIAERTRTVDTLRVAMLAALNVADEYHQLKARYEEVTQRYGPESGGIHRGA